MADLAYIRAVYPEFESISDDVVNVFLSRTLATVNRELFGDKFDDAHGSYTAHELELRNRRSSKGGRRAQYPLQSRSVGRVSVSFKVPEQNEFEAYFSSTGYGQRYLYLISICSYGIIATNQKSFDQVKQNEIVAQNFELL